MEGKKSKKGGKGGKKGSSKKSSSKKSKSKKSSSKKSRSKKSRRSKKGSRKTGKSSRTGGKQKTIDLKIPAHVLLSDPALATYQVKDIGAKLSEIYILLSSEDILTLRQKRELCPLVVKIRKINDLPCDVLAQNGLVLNSRSSDLNATNFQISKSLLCLQHSPNFHIPNLTQTHQRDRQIRRISLHHHQRRAKNQDSRITGDSSGDHKSN
jgi:hypothetical protein